MKESIIPYDKTLPFIEREKEKPPDRYLSKIDKNNYKVIEGRRPSNLLLVEKLRKKVNCWRDLNYPGISSTTKDLLTYWFDEDHKYFKYYYIQREAIETIIYLVETQKYSDLVPVIRDYGTSSQKKLFDDDIAFQVTPDGKRSIRRFIPELKQETSQEIPEENLLRYAFKIATGSGKTVVMALVIVWSFFNKRLENNLSLADNFLLIAPNVIVYERLKKDFAGNKIFNDLPLIPPYLQNKWNLKVVLRNDSGYSKDTGNLIIQNIQQLYESKQSDKWTADNVIQKIIGRPPPKNISKQKSSLLINIKNLPNLIVINDEAHHVHDDELEWNKILLSIHRALNGGLNLWLDFSATPKNQYGIYYPWTIVDYPLAQAVEDCIVKAPIILHRVNKDDPIENITQDNVIDIYNDWISASLERFKVHENFYRDLKKKPVLFIMTEKNTYADIISEYIKKISNWTSNEVVVIHTDSSGEIRKSELENLRELVKNIDEPNNNIKVVVSVLMLREGWDVQNVTIILGLRPFSSKAKILPEQAIGRGLRIIKEISTDSRQTLEILGTNAFEQFVRELEKEGVGINTYDNPPPLPIIVHPMKKKISYDIQIPQMELIYSHNYTDLTSINPLQLPSLEENFITDDIKIKMEYATTETIIGEVSLYSSNLPTETEIISRITEKVLKTIKIDSSNFSELFPIVKKYISERCFRTTVDISNNYVRKKIWDHRVQKKIISIISKAISDVIVKENPIKLRPDPIILSKTKQFQWRRNHIECKKTIFNYVATFNEFENRIADFLDQCSDIVKFAALAETFTEFKIDYLSSKGSIRFYYPDFIAVQTTKHGLVHWIIESKGREYEDTINKDTAIENWCKNMTHLLKSGWRYIKIQQKAFDRKKFYDFNELINSLKKS